MWRKCACPGPGSSTECLAMVTAEQVCNMLKTSKHGHARVPIEVIGLSLGKFVDEYTIRVIDVGYVIVRYRHQCRSY